MHTLWIAGALWITTVCFWVSRHERHADPGKFSSEAVQVFLVLAGLFTIVEIMSWLAIWLLT